MNNNTHQWSVVEYDDETIQIVPKCWVTIDDDGNMACYWPPFNFFSSNKRYISAVKKSMEAKPEWIKYGATILGTYDDFDKGMKKLKKAEDPDVPLTTDVEKDKVNRKLRHKRAYTSSDDSTEEKCISIKQKIKPIPKPPAIDDQQIFIQASSSALKSDKSRFLVNKDEIQASKSTDSSVDSNHSKKLKVKSKLFTDDSVGKITKPRRIYDVSSSNEEDVSTLYHKATTSDIQKPQEKTLFNAGQHINKQLVNSYHQPETIGFRGSPINQSKYQYINDQNNYSEMISNREFQEKVLKNLAFIKLTLKRLDEKISSVSSLSQPADDIDDEGIEEIFNDFPLSEEINLINLEEKLKKDMSYKKKLFNAVCKIGGIKTDDVTKLILRKLFTDKFAASYNWTGAKGKKPLSSLLLSKIIIDAVFKNAKDSKESDIIACIKNWMRHAEARYKNKLLKQKDDAANDLAASDVINN